MNWPLGVRRVRSDSKCLSTSLSFSQERLPSERQREVTMQL